MGVGPKARRRGLEAEAQAWKWAGGRAARRTQPPSSAAAPGGCPHPLLFSCSAGARPRHGGPQEVARAWKSPEGRLSSLHGPRKVGQRPWRPGHRPAPGEPAAPPAGAAWGRRGRGEGSARPARPVLLPGSRAFLKRRVRVARR